MRIVGLALFRTGSHPDMAFNQFLLGPWIGDGSPVSQTMWVDELVVADCRLSLTWRRCR